MNKVLFIVHPAFAIDCWNHENTLQTLKSFYTKVIRAIRAHKGPVIITMMTPYTLKTPHFTDTANRKEYNWFLEALSMTKARIYSEDKNYKTCRPLGECAFPYIEDMLLKGEVTRFIFGGGYFTSCLKATWDNFSGAFKTFCVDAGISVECDPEIVLDATYPSHTLSENGASPNSTYISWQ